MVPFLSFRMSQSAGGVSESEESIVISMSGTGGSETVTAASFTKVSDQGMSTFHQGVTNIKYGEKSDGNQVLMVTAQDTSYNPAGWYSNNDGSNWTKMSLSGGINTLTALGVRQDSGNTGPRFVATSGYTTCTTWWHSNDGATWTDQGTPTRADNPAYGMTRAKTVNYIAESGTWIVTARKKNCYTSNTGAKAGWTYQSDLVPGSTNAYAKHILGPVINSGANRRIVAHAYSTVKYNDADGVGGGTAVSFSGNNWTTSGSWGYGKTDANTWGVLGGSYDATNARTEWTTGDGATQTGMSPSTAMTDSCHYEMDGMSYDETDNVWYCQANDPTNSAANLWQSTNYGLDWVKATMPSDYSVSNIGNSIDHPQIAINPVNHKAVAVAHGHTASNVRIFRTDGPTSSGSSASLNITGDASAHSGVAQTVTFANGATAAEATTQVKLLFTDGTIGGYTVTDIDSTSFTVTSTEVGDETNLSFSTTAGTGGSLASSLTVTDGAG